MPRTLFTLGRLVFIANTMQGDSAFFRAMIYDLAGLPFLLLDHLIPDGGKQIGKLDIVFALKVL